MSKIKYEVGGITDCGNIRAANQDSILLRHGKIGKKEVVLAAVADGMGGRELGEMASSEVTRGLNAWWENSLVDCMRQSDWLKAVDDSLGFNLEDYNNRIVTYAREHSIKTGTTLSLLFLCDGKVLVKQVGDSRVYRMQKKKLVQLSKDQSWVQSQVDLGTMTVFEAEHHKNSNLLLNAIGNDYDLNVTTDRYADTKNSYYVLCSDGAYHYLKGETLEQLLSVKRSVQDKVQMAYQFIKSTRADDNFSVIIIHQEKKWF